MFELFKPFSSSTRDVRRKTIEESRAHLEAELGKPLWQLADLVWEAFDEFSNRAWRYSAKVLMTSLVIILALTLLFASNPYSIPYLGYEYITSYKSLLLSGVSFGALGISISLYLMAKKFGELKNVLKLKLPNLYQLDQRMAEGIAKDAVLVAVKSEYGRQMRHAQDFVSQVREARLEREDLRTKIEVSRASAWKQINSIEDAEQVLRDRIFFDSCTLSRGPVQWSAVCLLSRHADTDIPDQMGPPDTAKFGARFALFLETHCHTCHRNLRCDEPYQLQYSPVGELFGPGELSSEVPPLGKYKSWPAPDRGFDVFEGAWFCGSCLDATRAPNTSR